MTQEQHPITPPPELVQKLANGPGTWLEKISKAYCAGADQELNACCEEMKSIPSPLGIPFGEMASNALHSARRPKPPSLKDQALKALRCIDRGISSPDDTETIRRALEVLPD